MRNVDDVEDRAPQVWPALPAWRQSTRATRRAMLRGMGLSASAGVLTAACGGAPATPTDTQIPKQQVTIRFMTYAATAARWPAYEQILNDFQARYPTVKVDLQNEPSGWEQKLTTELAGGSPPDVVTNTDKPFYRFAAYSNYQQLDDLVKRDHYDIQDFYDLSLEECRYKSKLFALPKYFSTVEFFWNKSWFDELKVPHPAQDWADTNWTTDALVETGRKLVRKDASGQPTAWGVRASRALYDLPMWLWIFGGDYLSPDKTKCLLDQPGSIAALQFLSDLINKYQVAPPADGPQGLGGGSFTDETVAIDPNGAWSLVSYRRVGQQPPAGQQMIGKRQFEWDLAVPPRNKQRKTMFIEDVYTIPKATKQLDAAWLFLKYLSGKDGQKVMMQAGEGISPRKSLAEGPEFLDPKRPEKLKLYVDGIAQARPLPITIRWTDMQTLTHDTLAPLWFGQKSAQEVALQLKQQVDVMLADIAREGK